jgi:SAM-dependent methyltransferase
LLDKFDNSGSGKGQYFHQDMLVARKIFINKPYNHLDIGSRIDGFVAHVAVFRQIDVMDIRPQPGYISNVNFIQCDFMEPIKETFSESWDSVSCLHALEHFGLGRYGDPVNYNGHILGFDNLYRVLKKGGKLYFSVPIGAQRIMFNSGRFFSINYLLKQFRDKYHIETFSFVDDFGNLHENLQLIEPDIQNNFGVMFGCGIFEMTKL